VSPVDEPDDGTADDDDGDQGKEDREAAETALPGRLPSVADIR